MAADNPSGTVWTDQEVDLVVSVYFEMLGCEIAGQHFIKAQKNREIQQATRRSKRAIEDKFQNVSAVLDKLGLRWIWGYKPLPHYQVALVGAVSRYLDIHPGWVFGESAPIPQNFSDAPLLFFENPPDPAPLKQIKEPQALKRLVQKFNPVERDARNQVLGSLGEERVYFDERSRLVQAGRRDLARKVRWVSKEDGDGAGYDIKSYTETGLERLLEVKTTNGYRTTPFYLTENERSFSVERADAFRLVRLYDFSREPKAFELVPPLENSVILNPTAYRASFG